MNLSDPSSCAREFRDARRSLELEVNGKSVMELPALFQISLVHLRVGKIHAEGGGQK